MKVVDYQSQTDRERKPGPLGGVISGLGAFQFKASAKAQETVIQTLKKVLDNRFILLRGLVLPELEAPAPLLLFGPPGIWLIETSAIKGVFRAADDLWEEMDSQTQKFRPARLNLPARTAALAQAIASALNNRGLAVQSIEPVIIFTQPGAHVEAVRPLSRLVRSDAIARFGASLLQNPMIYSPEDVQSLVDALKEPAPAPLAAQSDADLGLFDPGEGAKQVSQPKKDLLGSQLSAALDTDEPEIIKRLSRRAAFTKRQWLILATLLVVNILVFAAIILVVLIIT